nr:B3 domain-containing protein Os07g0563300 isoform X1 [Ipomoea batatas]
MERTSTTLVNQLSFVDLVCMVSQSQNFDIIISTQPSNVCLNSDCKEASDWPRKGWHRLTGEFADLCNRCAYDYKENELCETFHLDFEALMKPYQPVRVNLLSLLYRKKIGGAILANEMGLGETIQARSIHGLVVKACIEENVFVESVIVDMYGKCECIEDCERASYANYIAFIRISKERRVDEALSSLDEGERIASEAKESKRLSPALFLMLQNLADQLASICNGLKVIVSKTVDNTLAFLRNGQEFDISVEHYFNNLQEISQNDQPIGSETISFNSSVADQEAVVDTVAMVTHEKAKENETHEANAGILFSCLGQAIIVGYLLAGSIIGPEDLKVKVKNSVVLVHAAGALH